MDIGRQEEPREAFTKDLVQEIDLWRQEGCEIVLGVDANENLKLMNLSSFRQQLSLAGMREAVLTRHGNTAPATHRRNQQNEPIDGLFHSDGITIMACGYYEFDHASIDSDHRGLWMDIDL